MPENVCAADPVDTAVLITVPAPCKVNATAFQDLATTEELTELVNVYHEYFSPEPDDDDLPAINPDVPLSFGFKEVTCGDLGMDVEQNMSPDVLASNLGFLRQRLPHQFNTSRHKSGTTPWADPGLFVMSPRPECLEPLQLHWHQLAGVHSIIRNTYTSTPVPGHCTGMLICDDVGLGKTALAISTIAFLNQVVLLQGDGQKLPLILREFLEHVEYLNETHVTSLSERYKFLNGRDSIDGLPHLIIAPGTLRAQWVHELQTLFRPKSVDIFLYDCPTTGNSKFWHPSGPFYSSKQAPQNKIIVTTHSVSKYHSENTVQLLM